MVNVEGGNEWHVKQGDTITLLPVLYNAGRRPFRIRHGSPLFVILAVRFGVGDAAGEPPPSLIIPSAQSWGTRANLEYPNPRAAYPAIGFDHVLAPGENYAPEVLFLRAEYRFALDFAGAYRLKVCARTSSFELCAARPIIVTVAR